MRIKVPLQIPSSRMNWIKINDKQSFWWSRVSRWSSWTSRPSTFTFLLQCIILGDWLIIKKGKPCIYEVNTFSPLNMETNPRESKEKQTEAIARVAHSWREDGRMGVRGLAKIFINILNIKLGLVFLCASQKLWFLTPQAHKLTYKGHV